MPFWKLRGFQFFLWLCGLLFLGLAFGFGGERVTLVVGDGPFVDFFHVVEELRELGATRVRVKPDGFGCTTKAKQIDELLYRLGFDVEEVSVLDSLN